MELNKIYLIGNLTRDPELRYTGSGTAVCDLRLAASRKYRKGGDTGEMVEETCFVDVVVWGRSGENCNQYLSKGNPVLVEGRLKLDEWQAQDGQKRSKHSVVADRVHFFPRSGGGAPSGESQSYGRSHQDSEHSDSEGSSQEDFNSEVPF